VLASKADKDELAALDTKLGQRIAVLENAILKGLKAISDKVGWVGWRLGKLKWLGRLQRRLGANGGPGSWGSASRCWGTRSSRASRPSHLIVSVAAVGGWGS
jgi:hypothetical protein